MKKGTDEERRIMTDLLVEEYLTAESVLYRFTSEKYLEKDNNGDYFLHAKTEPIDMVIDRYHGHYHVFIAREIGRGLSFLSKPVREYQIPGRVCVKVKIQDVLDQGGLLYTVSSLPAYIKAFFVSLPGGKIRAEKV